MKKIITFLVIINFIIFFDLAYSKNNYTQIHSEDVVLDNIEIIDWNFYVASRVAILYNLKLENNSNYTFNEIKVRINYYSRYPSSYGKKVGQQSKLLNIVLPPNSRKTYLKKGYPIGAGSQSMIAENLEIVSAKVVQN